VIWPWPAPRADETLTIIGIVPNLPALLIVGRAQWTCKRCSAKESEFSAGNGAVVSIAQILRTLRIGRCVWMREYRTQNRVSRYFRLATYRSQRERNGERNCVGIAAAAARPREQVLREKAAITRNYCCGHSNEVHL
jgi:hypothetical protein